MKRLTDTIPAVFQLLTNKELSLPSFSVTSVLPSIMNGSKDFSEWSKKDDLLYKILRLPVEAVLGRDGVGLADCAIAESKFEKGEDVAGRMLSLLPQLNEVRNRGTRTWSSPSAVCWPAARWQTDSPPARGAPSRCSVNALPSAV